MLSSIQPEVGSRRLKMAARLHGVARSGFWLLALGIMVVIPWSFGGNGPDGYFWIVLSGRFCLVPLGLWGIACVLRRERPGVEFWLPVVCWGLLAAQVIASLHNPSHETEPPWVGDGYVPIKHNESFPSTAFAGATIAEAHLWLALGLLALTARCVGLGRRQLRVLLWSFVINAAVLALIGIPFTFSGEAKILGVWEVQEKYFYSTFLYHNHWCAYALLALASAVALFDSTEKIGARIVLVIGGVAIAASAPLSTSRLGTLAMLAFGSFIVVTLLRKKFSPEGKKSRLPPGLILGVVLAVLVLGGSMACFYKARAFNRGDRTWSAILHSNPFGLRQTFVEDTIPMLKKKPWFGWGLGAYGAAFRFYQRPETRIVHNQGRVTLYEHIHNDWLEHLAELGLVGLSLFMAPGVLWLAGIRRQIPLSPIQRWLLAGAVGILVFAFGDMAFANRTVAAAFGIMLGLAAKEKNGAKISKTPRLSLLQLHGEASEVAAHEDPYPAYRPCLRHVGPLNSLPR